MALGFDSRGPKMSVNSPPLGKIMRGNVATGHTRMPRGMREEVVVSLARWMSLGSFRTD